MDLLTARRALVDFVYESMGLDARYQARADLSPYYLPIARPAPVRGDLVHVLSLFGDGVTQPLALMTDLNAWIHRQPGDDPRAYLETWRDLDPANTFEAWTYTVRRAASSLPSRSGEAGVSLYHDFKVLSAITHAALASPGGIQDGFTLISGDFPGIQRTIYTIASDGATKGVRGRSFFLQLLADCVVRRLLFDLGDLPMTNALMVAGGNFLLLGPASVGNRSAEEIVQETSAAISRELIDRFEGDVALVTAAMPISQDELVSGKEFGNVFSQLKALEGRRKKQPLRDVALADDDGWYAVFGVHGEGGKEACVVCQREPRDEGERRDFQRKEPCRTCRLFEELAQDLAKTSPPLLLFECEVNPDVLPGYARALHDITGWACSVRDRVPADTASGCVALQTNQVAFDSSMTDGFRLLATHTPIVQESDAGWIKKRYEDHLPQDWARWPQPGDIRDFDMLAHAHAIRQNSQTPALARLGVLKMDVDNLGTLFMDRLSQKSLAFRLAVSDALSLFFDGYLSVLCQRFEEDNERPNSLYLLYGGGDDLFIVGEWDMLPALAQHIRDEFVEYAASPVFSVSAGIVLAEPKFPFYRAAELAEAALSSAKDYERANGPSKDAIGFLGAVLPWKDGEAWHTVATEHARLLSMAARIPRGSTIIRHVLHIYERWQFDRRVRQMPTIYFGPYMWLSAYQMSRLADQYSVLRPDTRHIQQFLLQPDTIALSGPAARWAELEYRMQHIGHEEGEA